MSTIRGVKDRRFKFVQLLNDMFEDKELSLKAKGFIGYCLTKPEDWEFHVSHLCSVLKEGEDCIHATIRECISLGYAYRYRPRSPNGHLLNMVTIVSDSKFEIERTRKEHAECPSFKNSLPQRGFPAVVKPGVENPPPSNKDLRNTDLEKQQQRDASAAVLLKKEEERHEKKTGQNKPLVYDCLKDLDIPLEEKLWWTSRHDDEEMVKQVFIEKEKKQQRIESAPPKGIGTYKELTYACLHEINIKNSDKLHLTLAYQEDIVKNAILWATHPSTKINKSLAAAIKWACKEGPEVPKDEGDIKAENRAYALKYDGMQSGGVKIDVLSKLVNFEWSAVTACFSLTFDTGCFKEKFIERLKRHKFPIILE